MTGRTNGAQNSRFYRCNRRSFHGRGVQCGRVHAGTIEGQVWTAVEKALKNPTLIANEVRRQQDTADTQQSVVDREQEFFLRELAKDEKQLKKWEAAHENGAIDFDDFKMKKAEITARRASFEEELAR